MMKEDNFMNKKTRIHLIVLDSVGAGAAPDASNFNDLGCNTLGHIFESRKMKIPNLENLGLGAILELKNVSKSFSEKSYVGKLQEQSVGKDTMTGHWELMGLISEKPFAVFPNGFSETLLDKIEQFSGRKIVCNKPYSGTEVINDYGAHQMSTGDLIVYTSADPVLQIAAHEEIIPLKELYKICDYARQITLEEPNLLGRIIARPYIGSPGNFARTSNRHDYALDPFGTTTLDILKENDKEVIGIGKINDIFNGRGITQYVRTKNNMDGVDQLLQVMKKDFEGISFTNLVDFDANYGHRRDVHGYGKAIEEFDQRIPEILDALEENDYLIITADHGNDPTFHGTDHTREYVPIIVYSKSFKEGGDLPQGFFSDVSKTMLDIFELKGETAGTSFLRWIK